MVILIKPQFEVGKGQVGKGGIVREPQLHQAACERVTQAVREFGFKPLSWPAPFWAPKGTRSFSSMPIIKTVGVISKPNAQIGRASCRERVQISVVAVS